MQREQEEKLMRRLRADSSESPSPVRPQKVDITSSESNTPASKSTQSDDESESKSNLGTLFVYFYINVIKVISFIL